MNNFIPVNKPLLKGNEKKYLNECIDTGWISSEGKFVKEFEKKFAKQMNRKYAVSVTNGTAALELVISRLNLKPGDEVIVTGFDMGMNTFGGFGEYIKVPQEWIVKKPEKLTLSESMAFGTAGLTAGLCLRKLLAHGLKPDDGDVFVSGVTGGVGIISLMLFKKLGFSVSAITGKLDQEDFLKSLGANQVIDRNTLDLDLISPLQKPLYSGGIDAVGGKILSNLICSTSQRAAIACCGMVGGLSLDTSIFPFILRGLSLFGIDSAESLLNVKEEIWNNFSSNWKLENIDENVKDISLDELPNEIDKILRGELIGRVRIVYD